MPADRESRLKSLAEYPDLPLAVTDREGEAVLHLAGDIADTSANLYPAAPPRPVWRSAGRWPWTTF